MGCAEKEVAERSVLIKNMMEDVGEEAINEAIPIPNVNESVLKKVIEWCLHHRGDPPATADDDSDARKKTTDIDEWDQRFMQVDQEMLFEIILVGCSAFTLFATSILTCGIIRLPTTSISRLFLMSDARPLPT
ncbi:MAG: hypothetical protein Q9187_008124 [Circinaria calcarea]